MRILFICRANVGRSQMAMEFYNQLFPAMGDSAGTEVDLPGQKLKERGPAVEVVLSMKELDIDMSDNLRTQLTPELAKGYDKLVVLLPTEAVPGWLQISPKSEFWDARDMWGLSLAETRVIRDEIKQRVRELAKRVQTQK